MAESPRIKPAVTRRQVAVIAVLGVVLAVVLIAQFGGASGQPAEPQAAAGKQQRAQSQPKAAAPQPGGAVPQPRAAVPQKNAAGPQKNAAAPQKGEPSNPLRAPGVATSAQPEAAVPQKPQKDSSAWPKLRAEAVAQYDPFAMPEPLARQTQAEQAKKAPAAKPAPRDPAADPALAALRSKGARAVFRDGTGAAAVIDNRVVHVGDVMQGYRVVSIDDDGVLVAPSGSQDVREDRK